MDDKEKIRKTIQANHYFRLEQEKKRLRDRQFQQNFRGTVIGRANSSVIVSIQGGRAEATALSNTNFNVGDVASYFIPSDSSTGFVDKMTVG